MLCGQCCVLREGLGGVGCDRHPSMCLSQQPCPCIFGGNADLKFMRICGSILFWFTKAGCSPTSSMSKLKPAALRIHGYRYIQRTVNQAQNFGGASVQHRSVPFTSLISSPSMLSTFHVPSEIINTESDLALVFVWRCSTASDYASILFDHCDACRSDGLPYS